MKDVKTEGTLNYGGVLFYAKTIAPIFQGAILIRIMYRNFNELHIA